jgi:hypothetical protein
MGCAARRASSAPVRRRAAGKAPVSELLDGPPQAAFWHGVLALESAAGI